MELLNYREAGEGPPLIILHGVFGSSDNWLTIAKYLGEDFKLYIVDQRNHGASFHSDEWNYEAMRDDLKYFMDEMGLSSAYILGHSMGGKTAMHFASTYPEMTDKLVIVDIAPKKYPPHHGTILKGLTSVDLASSTKRSEIEAQLAEYVPDKMTRQFLLKNLGRDDDNNFYWKLNLPVVNEQMEEIGQPVPEDATYEGPALLIYGLKSKYVQETDKALFKSHFPRVTFAPIEDAGHWIHAEQPQKFVEALKGFLL